MTDLEYPDVMHEVKGAMASGRLKLSEQNIIFKNNKTGKVDNISASDIDLINWQKFVTTCGLRIFLKNGTLHRYHGFKEAEHEKLSKFISANYKKDLADKDMSLKGWNWGTAKFSGSVLSFDIGSHTAFEIPLNYVSQCTTGKNEVTVEYHQNDDAAVSLMEMRFHIPSSELAGEDTVDAFHQNVMNKASVISVSGDALAIFREIHCLNPRGRYDLKVYSSFFQLHGKTFDYKIPAHTVLRLFLLPHHDKRQIFFVVSLDPPIKQGQTRYHYLVCLFPVEDDEISIELPYTEEELKEKYEGKLEKEMKGQTYEVLGKLTKAIVGRKLTMPNYVGKSDTPAIACSYKAAAGYVYPLERGFMFLRKPPFYTRFEEIVSVNFARGGGGMRSFDFEVEVKSGIVHTFSSIEKDEYGKLYDFITAKKLVVKNRGKSDKPSFGQDDLVDSDQEEPDAYLARVKREAKERDDDDGSNDESSTDEDFKPGEEESDVAEEYDTDAASSESDEEGGGGGSDGTGKPEKKEKKRKTITISEKPRKKKEKKEKHKKDSGAPKRPQSAYFIWMNENRDNIKEKHPGFSVAEVAKKAGEMWRELKDKSEWEEKAKKAKSNYEEAMREYKASGGGADDMTDGKSSKKKSSSSPSKASLSMSGAGYKSKEYLSDTGSSSDDGEKSGKKKGKGSDSDSQKEAKPKKSAPKSKAKKETSGDSGSDSEKETKSKKSIAKPKDGKKKGKGTDSDSQKEAKPKKPAPKSKAKKESSDDSESDSEKETKSKKSIPKPKAKKESSAEESGSDDEAEKRQKRKKSDSDQEGNDFKKLKMEDIENDDNLPEEPDESTPATTEDSENDSGSDSD